MTGQDGRPDVEAFKRKPEALAWHSSKANEANVAILPSTDPGGARLLRPMVTRCDIGPSLPAPQRPGSAPARGLAGDGAVLDEGRRVFTAPAGRENLPSRPSPQGQSRPSRYGPPGAGVPKRSARHSDARLCRPESESGGWPCHLAHA